MQAAELRLAVVDVVLALSQFEIDDVDGVELAHLVVVIAQVDVLRDGLGHPVEHPVEVVQLVIVLHLDDEQAAQAVLDQHVGAVELVGRVLLVAFALQETDNAQVLAQQGGEETFQHDVIALVAQQAFHRPVESDQVLFHTFIAFSLISAKLRIMGERTQPCGVKKHSALPRLQIFRQDMPVISFFSVRRCPMQRYLVSQLMEIIVAAKMFPFLGPVFVVQAFAQRSHG